MIAAQLEVLAQGRAFLAATTDAQYVEVIRPQFMSSSGAHMRHILDHYRALTRAGVDGMIDYEARERGGQIERSREAASSALDEVESWLRRVDPALLSLPRLMRTEVQLSARRVETIPTTLARELVFAASHAVHHYAMIAQVCAYQRVRLEPCFGVAPSTRSHLRAAACAR
jgi:hypothetical protein